MHAYAGASEDVDIFAAAAALAEDKALAAEVLSVEFVPQVGETHWFWYETSSCNVFRCSAKRTLLKLVSWNL